jgi:hypothetical protein
MQALGRIRTDPPWSTSWASYKIGVILGLYESNYIGPIAYSTDLQYNILKNPLKEFRKWNVRKDGWMYGQTGYSHCEIT